MKFTPRHLAWPVLLIAIAMMPASIKLSAQGGPEVHAAAGKLVAETTKPKAKPAKKLVKKKAKAAKKAAKKGPPPTPAKVLFGAAKSPAPLAARAIGFYAKGCLAGAKAIPVDGPAWQVMRLSRNRMWGHPSLIALIERLAKDGKENDGWSGLLVGDISQPRGGPMLTGHASHQVGLDADIWLTPMPDRRLTNREREDLSATSMLADDRVSINPKVWTEAHGRIITRAASYPQVERVLVHPAIKKAICESKSLPREHLNKIRPYWGHHYHMHIRMACPKDSPGCTPQFAVGDDDGCGKEVDEWIARMKRIYAPRPPAPEPKVALPKPKPKPKPEITLADLPTECKAVIGDTSPPGPSPVADVTKPQAPAKADDEAENAEPSSAPPAKKPSIAGHKK
ncbi:MAG TPA: penicillin-insensitive murein endopeptidase [Hyphomicrobiaceae bacterium]|nr:penicillin-insensitive murein endopeptidase [Hyphomicrobiaceae bacterium]